MTGPRRRRRSGARRPRRRAWPVDHEREISEVERTLDAGDERPVRVPDDGTEGGRDREALATLDRSAAVSPG